MGSTFFRRWIGGFLAVCLTLTGMPALCVSGAEPAVSAQSCILMEAVTGEILYEKQAQEQRPMASTTKIMTTLLCLESGDLDTEFPVDTDAIHVEGSSMGLVEGDIVTKRALCYGMLLPSGNDAAGAAAVKLAGNYAAFAEQMNQKAAELGMTQTHFVTPSGLHDDQHYSTAYDCPEVRALFPDSKPVQASILCYPVITADPAWAHLGSFDALTGKTERTPEEIQKFSCEKLVTDHTPPAFLWHTAADGSVPVMNSLLYAQALAAHRIPFELHVYPEGEHGLATSDARTLDKVLPEHEYAHAWLDCAKKWLHITLKQA